MSEKAFSFLDMPNRSTKPRVDGMTMCIDQGLGLDYTKDLLSLCSEYVDLWKLGWATTQLQSSDLVKAKIKLLRSHDISICNGGTLLELSEHQDKAELLFDEMINLGYDSAEISSGSLDIDSDRVAALIQSAKSRNLRVFCEVGKKLVENDLNSNEYNSLMKKYLEAGAEKVILEARESGVSVGVMDDDGKPKEERLAEVLDGIDPSKVIFESPKKSQQVFFLKKFGPETNLGNIQPTDVISVETLRRGLRGDTIDDFFVIVDRHLKKQGMSNSNEG
jgi:phosphosulfolactate synthase